MKSLSLLCLLLLSASFSFQLKAQSYTLEQLDMSSDTLNPVHTYVMDINNRGFVVGYYTDVNGYNIGYIMTRKGVIFDIDNNVIIGSDDVKVVSINDNDVALVSSTIGGVTTLYKIYVADEAISSPVTVGGLGQNPVNALKINNKNDISGWYQGVNSRWLFILHDSIIPAAMPQWQASRYMPAATYYNTWGSGMDTNNMIAGYYLDAPNFYPFLYDATNNSYQVLTAPAKTKVWDMNNGHMMVGEYQQGNGVYMAFWGTITGNTLNVNSLASIFHNNSIQSVANGVNDHGVVVGNFYDTSVNKWKGFIYRPGQAAYEYPGYNFVRHTWKPYNGSDTTVGNTDAHWNSDFCNQYIHYDLFDTYMWNGIPLNDSIIKKKYKKNYIPNTLHPDWKSFAIEADKFYSPNGTANDKAVYKAFKKYKLFDRYVKFIRKNSDGGIFQGDCYGFSTTSMMYYCDSSYLNTRYDVPLNIDLSSVSNMDSIGKRAIVRGQLQQFNPVIKALDEEGIFPWCGLYRTKTYMMDPLQKVNIRTLSFVLVDGTDTGGHAVFPYKILTPQKLPFKDPVTQQLAKDTVMVYDPNYPMDSTIYLAVNSARNFAEEGFFSNQYTVLWVDFEEPTITQLKNYPFANLKPKRGPDTLFDFCFGPQTDYVIQSSNYVCSQVNNQYGNGIPFLFPEKGTGPQALRPLYFISDTSRQYSIHLNHYEDSVMSITQTVDDLSMGISRNALPAEQDNLSTSVRRIAYGNPENISKSITCHYVQTSNGAVQSVNLLADNLSITPNDSVITLSPYDYAYQIIHPGGGNLTYDLDLFALYTDTIKHFTAGNIAITTNTSHLIDPYYVGSNGSQTVIYVDNGLNGSHDDTLFVQEVALGNVPEFSNVSYVKVFPNPARDQLNVNIQWKQSETFTVLLADIYGRILHREQISHRPGTTRHPLSVSHLPAGTCYVTIFDSKQQLLYMEKLLKE